MGTARSIHNDFPLLTLEWIGLCSGIAATLSDESISFFSLHLCSIIVSASCSHSFMHFYFGIRFGGLWVFECAPLLCVPLCVWVATHTAPRNESTFLCSHLLSRCCHSQHCHERISALVVCVVCCVFCLSDCSLRGDGLRLFRFGFT
ncbi:uncharacterized protein TM35_000131970 [Trypanosoma theileri]|uniref:Uncharacterized protein n=1 Tax=Trypanosoma theileri TaxID=67003 RepID=A0A1X0NXI7_9TRYP|nr:uncharacterized protein TM35_000131970 [Trypanosoma theileri]ORC89193.1 hypothetical protein TM35_000131970 [Trypanosoma theileri]